MEIQERIDVWADHHRGFFFDLVRIYLGIGLTAKAIWFMRHPDVLACDGESSGFREAVRTGSEGSLERLPICPEGWGLELPETIDRQRGASAVQRSGSSG